MLPYSLRLCKWKRFVSQCVFSFVRIDDNSTNNNNKQTTNNKTKNKNSNKTNNL